MLCERGEMADTTVLEAVAARREGSSPFARTKWIFRWRFKKGSLIPL